MSDGVTVGYPASVTALIATDEVVRGSVTEHQQIVKISLGADGETSLLNIGQQNSVSSFPVVIASDQSSLTVVGSVTVNNPTVVSTTEYTSRKNEEVTYTYAGFALPGSRTDIAVWKIKRLDNTSGDVLFADGNSNFDNIWSNHVSLSYY